MSMSVVLGCKTLRGLNIFAGLLIVRVPRNRFFHGMMFISVATSFAVYSFPTALSSSLLLANSQAATSQPAGTNKEGQTKANKEKTVCVPC